MREIPLTRGKVALVDDEDYARIAAHRWYCTNNGYAARSDASNTTILMHREVLGFPLAAHIDHINHDKLDNTRRNLRACTASQNLANRKAKHARRFKGVWKHRSCNRWQAEIRVEGKRYHLGLHKTIEEAARAYDAAAIEHFGSYAFLNFPHETASEQQAA